MRHYGFVLAGGGSTRMGQDKALLPYRGTTLVEYLAWVVSRVVGSVAVIGDPERYRDVKRPVYADRRPGLGPLGGLYTALSMTPADWNVVVACDMPGISPLALRMLIEPEAKTGRNAVMAKGPSGEPEPLCAAYHRSCLALLAQAIRNKRFKMMDLIPYLRVEYRPLDPALLVNVNTPDDWAKFQADVG